MDKTAIVTGASRGIGRAIAIGLAQDGYDICALAWQDDSQLQSLADEIGRLGRKCIWINHNIADTDGLQSVLDRLPELPGPLTCLVNNAGVSVLKRGDLLEVEEDSFDRCFEVNTRGTFFFTQAIAKYMVSAANKSGGHRSVIFITSSNAVSATVERGEYCMSKAASHMAARLFAIRLAQEGIATYEVQPGLILTEMTAPSKEKYDRLIADGMTLDKRWGLPEDVARVVRTMAAGLLPYTVAQEVRVDGGLMMQRF